MLSIVEYVHHPRLFIIAILKKVWFLFSDDWYLRFLYWLEMGHPLNLDNPRTFTEKIQWLKLYNREKIYSVMVDKIAVKNYVSNIIGEDIIIPTLGVWKKFDDIDFSKLPNEFVLKTNHSGGGSGVIICRNKFEFDIKKAREKINSSMKCNYYYRTREWPYKDVFPKIFAEKFIKAENEEDLIDYKFYCFNGQAKYCQVIIGRRNNESIDFYDLAWNHQNFYGLNPTIGIQYAHRIISKPCQYEKMIEIANKLSKGIPFVRIDLYNVLGKIYFSEITFFPASGFGFFIPRETDALLGKLIKL